MCRCSATPPTPSTGDNQRVAQAVAGAIGIPDYRAALRPEDKLAYVKQAAAAAEAAAAAGGTKRGLLMAGDGINDAPALAAAQARICVRLLCGGRKLHSLGLWWSEQHAMPSPMSCYAC